LRPAPLRVYDSLVAHSKFFAVSILQSSIRLLNMDGSFAKSPASFPKPTGTFAKSPNFQHRHSSSQDSTFQTVPGGPVPSEGCEEPRCTTPHDEVWYCVDCSVRFCETCWKLCLQHQPGRTARDGIEHERTVYHEVERLRDIMNPPSSQERLLQMHGSDEDTTWFGEPH
jgi:hypothetical protein